MKYTILSDRYTTHEIINEDKESWIINMLLLLGIPEEGIDFDASILTKYGIEVWNNAENGDVEIKQNNILIAKWYYPELIPQYDEKQNIYYEINFDSDSIFENKIYDK